jgi:hypothetical protein
MAKKAVKLNAQQLRGLIREAIQHRPMGMDEADLDEAGPKNSMRHNAAMKHNPTTIISKAVDDIEKFWKALYEEDKSSMAELDQEDWDEQVKEAVEELYLQFLKSVNEVDAKLTDGVYAHSDDAGF